MLNFRVAKDFAMHQKNILIRHDVDFDLECALEMAILERKMEVQANYFILSNSPYYNLKKEKYKRILFEISNLNHEIGLHYDAGISETVSFEKQLSVLQATTKKKISNYSQHNPTLNGFNKDNQIIGIKDIFYSNAEFNPVYLSDSCMVPRSDFDKTIRNTENIHLLVHPEFWILETSNLTEFEDALLNKKSKKFHEYVKKHVAIMRMTLENRPALDEISNSPKSNSENEF